MTQMIYGYPFESTDLADLAKCLTCGQIVDVGGELRAHVNDHIAEKYEVLE